MRSAWVASRGEVQIKSCGTQFMVAACVAIVMMVDASKWAAAAPMDLAADFSATNNPNGVWFYVSFDLGHSPLLSSNTPDPFDTQSWHSAGSDTPFVGLTTVTPVGFLSLHPGSGTNGSDLWVSVAFVAPTDGAYHFAGEFLALDGNGTCTISDHLIQDPKIGC